MVKLETIAKETIRIIQDSKDSGISIPKIASSLNVPCRRVYDVIAILKALNFITLEKSEDRASKVLWSGQSFSPNINISRSDSNSDDLFLPLNKFIISALPNGKIKKLQSSKLQVYIEVEPKGIYIKTINNKN